MASFLSKLSIRTKMVLLAGVPVVGALLLSAMIVQDARQRSAAAAALGSIEDVAQLSLRITSTVRALQQERAGVALNEGISARKPDSESFAPPVSHTDLKSVYAQTDTALSDLDRFLDGRDLSNLPPRLARGLDGARAQLAKRDAFRQRVAAEDVPVDAIAGFYDPADDALINATAALTQLSDDGELLRSISSLVALSQLTERASEERALLSYVFGATQFPPGAFKTLVTLTIEQQLYADVFRANAADAYTHQYEQTQTATLAAAARAMREQALASTDDTLNTDATYWFRSQGAYVTSLHEVQMSLMQRISQVATAKMTATRTQLRRGLGLSGLVVAVSIFLAWIIARGVTRTVMDLSRAAQHVRETRDYATRAKKTSTDELGTLTDAFNEMLHGIQTRDKELEEHKNGLEATVAARTAELTSRNEAMRVVLDNVDQGLVTFRADGTLDGEHSSALERWFGVPEDGTTFAAYLGKDQADQGAMLRVCWDMVIEDVMPLELTIEQLPKEIVKDGAHYSLGFKPMMKAEKIDGALLVVTDITSEVQARRDHEEQQEHIAIFTHIAKDREGFSALIHEVGGMVTRVKAGVPDVKSAMAILHTIKGTSAICGLLSVASVAHQLESRVVETRAVPTAKDIQELVTSWERITKRAMSFLDTTRDRADITRPDLDRIIALVRSRTATDELVRNVEFLKHEPAVTSFQRMADQADRLAARLDKPAPRIIVDANDVRLPASRFGAFWTSSIHIIRNSMDHGIESASDRVAAGKTPEGLMTLTASLTHDRILIEFSDDGRGIAWQSVAKKARNLGMPWKTRSDLKEALFSSGFSTKSEVTDISGRGVGLSAVAECAAELGGDIDIESNPGRGTRFMFSFPRGRNQHSLPPIGHVGKVA